MWIAGPPSAGPLARVPPLRPPPLMEMTPSAPTLRSIWANAAPPGRPPASRVSVRRKEARGGIVGVLAGAAGDRALYNRASGGHPAQGGTVLERLGAGAPSEKREPPAPLPKTTQRRPPDEPPARALQSEQRRKHSRIAPDRKMA